MLKKCIAICTALLMIFTLTACSSNDDQSSEKKTNENNEEQTDNTEKIREFTESAGVVKYITINGDKVAIPETVGEYVNYLKKIGTVELGDTGDTIENADKMDANATASLTSYLKVFTSGSNYQWFGLHYFNPKDSKITVSLAKIDRIILSYDIYAEDGMSEYQEIDTMVLITENGEIPIDGKTTSKDIVKIMGNPIQNTDGYLKYTDSAGYTYKFATENQKGILTQVQIDYPK